MNIFGGGAKGPKCSSGTFDILGRRTTMEDAWTSSNKKNHAYYAVFDGHGGQVTSNYCKDHFFKLLEETNFYKTNSKEEREKELAKCYERLDKEIIKNAREINDTSGSTAVTINIIGRDLIVGNLGDAEAVIGRKIKDKDSKEKKYEPVLLTKRHKPTDESEVNRIKQAGGHIIFGRVMGQLAVSRAFGDQEFKEDKEEGQKDFVSAVPSISTYSLSEDDSFIIIACDGLWDKLTYEQAVNIASEKKGSPEEIAKRLVEASFNAGSMDNITCIFVVLKW